jgi:hypothetical protein
MRRCCIPTLAAVLVSGVAASLSAGADPTAQAIHQRVEKVKTSEPTGWTKIPWTASIVEARRLSKAENQPIFLFTHDGNIETGRC